MSTVECYMKEHGVEEEFVYDVFKQRVEDAWKDINNELLTCKDVPMALKTRVLNLAREDSQKKHVMSTLECYMKEHGVEEEYVYDLFKQRVEDAWKDINHEFLICKDVPMVLKTRVLNLARVMEILYKYDDTLKNVGEELKDNIKSCFVNAMSV
ncbi:hypothetical protein R6Q57_004222 [Mikania cordata]